MKFRVARHTSNLKEIIHFYHDILGLEILGSFENHNKYDGVFLGLKNENWHIEFTVSNVKPTHQPDDDDLLVFYPKTDDSLNQILMSLKDKGINPEKAKNPYWEVNGFTFKDPDGYRIVIAKPNN